MAQSLIARAWAWLHATFPERQIYIRSVGRVQFFSFGSTLQATCAGLTLIFLGWVAFASVNVIFKDRIIAAKDHRFQQMQVTYEGRVADLQLSYDELNNALLAAEDRFKSTADELQTKQQGVARLLGEKEILDTKLASIGDSPARDIKYPRAPTSAASSGVPEGMADDSLGTDAAPPGASPGFSISPPASSASSGSGASELSVMPQTEEPQPRTARPSKASFLDDVVQRFAETLFPADRPAPAIHLVDTPALRMLAEQTNRVKQLGNSETELLVSVDRAISDRIAHVQGLLRRVGVNSQAFERQASQTNVGGPLVPIQSVRIEGIADSRFTANYENALAHTSELNSLFTALRHVPLTTPVHGPQFEFTSGFGPRIDPFTGRLAFHTGVDFAGPWGSTVVATAPGVVVWAGNRGGYGNMVEVDHGYGFHTRYGHLASVLVRAGTRVDEDTPIGKLGSTGRSTGPHVHYEVWLANSVKDPNTFIEAGRNAFE